MFFLIRKAAIEIKTGQLVGIFCFFVYIIHHQHFVLYSLIGPVVLKIHGMVESPFFEILALSGFALFVLFVCIVIDKIFSPLWRLLSSKAYEMDKKVALRLNSVIN